ncbi:MAG TPA: response regulator transcription factor [Acidimicrobiia bacterium]|nr:response regulator transcription factor [Acidimicrobiia bacterium]
MLVALHPEQPSAPLVEALLAAGYRPVPVADAAAVADQEPETGWGALVVELGEDPTAAVALARRVRRDGSAPVLVVATRAQVGALPPEAGDDFLLSPIDPAELSLRLRRLRALAAGEPAEETLRFKDLELNPATYQARLAGTPLDLTYMEYELLRFFAGHPTRVWSREQLLSRVWGYDYFGGARTVDVHVRRLRAKLGETRASWITTVRSVGYRFG